jgi:hypothetical protein
MKVSDGTILAEKVSSVEFEAAPDTGFELGCFGIPANGLQRAKIVSGMKVVNPTL